MQPMTTAEFLEHPTVCPACGAEDITYGTPVADPGVLRQDATCGACQAQWVEVFSLVSYRLLTVPHP
jgi:hypothetical protein